MAPKVFIKPKLLAIGKTSNSYVIGVVFMIRVYESHVLEIVFYRETMNHQCGDSRLHTSF